ncbi:dimethyl sulfoxide reductase anchor subunit family protein [Lysobacter cavernae]|uniref:Dimethyl sulfoxide reductase anchor subunit family protein n=1 Tax=Lysobacter cavernae TaxID=1685901 RepID=A0ABV7RP18_9GAMM
MHPALSVIFFTALSGAGYGLLAWTGLAIVSMLLSGDRPQQGAVPAIWGVLILVGLVLVTTGLLSSVLHLGKPGRAWRAFSQWRSSWLSREGVLALASYVPAVALLALVAAVASGQPHALLNTAATPLLAAAMLLLSLATVVCTAMIYASLKPIPAWRHRLVVPGYLAFALLTGGLLFAVTLALVGVDAATVQALAVPIAAAAALVAALKLAYWRAIDREPLPVTRGDALGLPERTPSVFERPHTEPNYLTREMVFVLARKHARRLRAIGLVLFGALPVLAAALAWALPASATLAFGLAAASALAGALVERWLFFAQARHLVSLYY